MKKSIKGFPVSYTVGQSKQISNIEIAPILKHGVETIFHFAFKVKGEWKHVDVRNIGLNDKDFNANSNRLDVVARLIMNRQTNSSV